MKTIIFCLIGGIALILGLWSQSASQQTDAKSETKKKRRDIRYHSTIRNIANIKSGQKEVTFVDFVDMTGYDPKKSSKENDAIRDKLEKERKEKRKSVACSATVILFGTVKDLKGYATSDNTNIYTVYRFVVTEVIRAPQSMNFNANEIEFTMPGGYIKAADGGIITVEHPTYSQLAPNLNHILLLKYDEEADDYFVIDPIGIYTILTDGTVVRGDSKHFQLAKEAVWAREPNTTDAIIAELKSLECAH